jgi:hypothetical protein
VSEWASLREQACLHTTIGHFALRDQARPERQKMSDLRTLYQFISGSTYTNVHNTDDPGEPRSDNPNGATYGIFQRKGGRDRTTCTRDSVRASNRQSITNHRILVYARPPPLCSSGPELLRNFYPGPVNLLRNTGSSGGFERF